MKGTGKWQSAHRPKRTGRIHPPGDDARKWTLTTLLTTRTAILHFYTTSFSALQHKAWRSNSALRVMGAHTPYEYTGMGSPTANMSNRTKTSTSAYENLQRTIVERKERADQAVQAANEGAERAKLTAHVLPNGHIRFTRTYPPK